LAFENPLFILLCLRQTVLKRVEERKAINPPEIVGVSRYSCQTIFQCGTCDQRIPKRQLALLTKTDGAFNNLMGDRQNTQRIKQKKEKG
jgi:hypothetical protein